MRTYLAYLYARILHAQVNLRQRLFGMWLSRRRHRLAHADLSYLNLQGTNLKGGNLRGANLHRCDLTHVDLTGADLRDADLSGALVADHQLAGAASLEGAILPDGRRVPAQGQLTGE